MDNFFTITNDDLERLSDREAVESFKDLLHAEAQRLEIPRSSINISSDIYIGDGGVDADVTDSPVKDDLIRDGYSAYQIKTGTDFSPLVESKIRKELIEKKKGLSNELKSQVKKCLDRDGTYVLVCFGRDFNSKEKSKAESKIREIFKEFGYENSKVLVFGQNQIGKFFSFFPSLALRINRRDGAVFDSHLNWSKQSEMRRQPFERGEEQSDLIRNIQDSLSTKNDTGLSSHIRLFGEAGVGKTRLVLEATKENGLETRVIYCNTETFLNNPLLISELQNNQSLSAILILDECNETNSRYIWDKFQFVGNRIRIISITNEIDETSGNTRVFEVKKLTDGQLTSIIRTNVEILEERAGSWARECGGSPRAAHVIAQNLRENPDDIFRSPDTVNFWDRYITGYEKSDSARIQQTKVVLRHLALFKKFGSPPRLESEAKVVWEIVIAADGSITWPNFIEIINELKRKKILQGEYTLDEYIGDLEVEVEGHRVREEREF